MYYLEIGEFPIIANRFWQVIRDSAAGIFTSVTEYRTFSRETTCGLFVGGGGEPGQNAGVSPINTVEHRGVTKNAKHISLL